MKYLLIFVLLAGLAVVEYVHHRSDGHASHDMADAAPHQKMEGARDMLRQHLQSHR